MGRPQNLARKREIIEGSLKVFSREVSWDTSLNELARQLKTSTRMLVHHFETREKLVRACKVELKNNSEKGRAVSVPSQTGAWINLWIAHWQRSLEELPLEQHRLRVLTSLQTSHKMENKIIEVRIENLRELLPSRLKKFAEEIFIFEQGLLLQILAGRSLERTQESYRFFLKRLEKP